MTKNQFCGPGREGGGKKKKKRGERRRLARFCAISEPAINSSFFLITATSDSAKREGKGKEKKREKRGEGGKRGGG